MADVSAALKDWSATSSSNSPSGSTAIGTGLDDNLREIQGAITRGLSHKGSDIASAATTDLGAIEGLFHDITGTTTITSFGTVRAGILKVIKFEGALTLTHNATSLILPGGANITTANGDIAIVSSEGSGNWRCASYVKAATAPAAISAAQSFLGASDVLLNNTSNYFDITNTGSIGGAGQTWLLIGNACITDTAGAASVVVRIWDSSTVFAEASGDVRAANATSQIPVFAIVTPSAAATYYLSAKDLTSTSGVAKTTGYAGTAQKACSITAIRLL